MAIIRLSVGERKRLSIFFTCIVLAFTAWMLFSLSQKYDYQIKTLVTFKNLPVNKAFYPLQSDTVVLTVEGTGWQLLFNKVSSSVTEIKVDLSPLERRNFISFSNQIKDINKQFSSNQIILKVYPDTLFFDFATRKVKRVPVRLASNITYKKQFGQSKSIVIKPAYVTITGPTELLQKIDYWETDTLRKTNVDKSITARAFLKPSSEANISIFPNAVDIQLPVEEFTEKIVQVPVKISNNPNYYYVKIIPNTVTARLMVSLSDYSKINEESISAFADLSLWKAGANKLPVTIQNQNQFVKVQQVAPQQVDFMITK